MYLIKTNVEIIPAIKQGCGSVTFWYGVRSADL
jgi:hypothetical protein